MEVMDTLQVEKGTHDNGSIRLRKTHLGLYRIEMITALTCLLLSANFVFTTPTFLVYGWNYHIWAAAFFLVAVTKVVFLTVRHNLELARTFQAITMFFFVFYGVGTMQPFFTGMGSLQLPTVFLCLTLIEASLLIEPYINPITAERNGKTE